MHYTFDAANRMIAALDEPASQVPLRVYRALHIGCENLRRVSRELAPGGPLARDMALAGEMRRTSEDGFRRAVESVESFAGAFMHIEQSLLQEAGASRRLLRLIPQDREKLLCKLRETDLDSDGLKSKIDRLCESVCELRDTLNSDVLAPNAGRNARRRLRRATLGIFGAGTVAANASADLITTFGLAPWATALSATLGTVLIDKAATGD